MGTSRDRIEATFQVPPELSDQRLDQAVATLMPEHSRSRIQNWVKSGELTVNGQPRKPRDKVLVDDEIVVVAEAATEVSWEPEPIDLDILYEDEHLIVINKPAGLVVHPAAGHEAGTLVNALLHHAPELERIPRAGIVHRLDKDTTGIMVVARSLEAHTSLVEQLQSRSMGRQYEAVCVGTFTGGGQVDAPIGRHPVQRKKMAVVEDGKPAVTHYRIVARFAGFSQIRCQLETGRTHQIRVHMAHINHPLVGDTAYNGRMRYPRGADSQVKEVLEGFRRQALHARTLTLVHPWTREVCEWQAPLPGDLERLIEELSSFTERTEEA